MMSGMDGGVVDLLERELLSWPGVFRKYDENGIGGIPVTGYRYGDPETGGPQIGHLHHDGVVDLQFPKEVRDEIVGSGRAGPHRGGFRAVVSYEIAGEEDIPGAVELFRLNYERIVERAENREGRVRP